MNEYYGGRRPWLLFSALLLCIIALYALPATGQTLQPVTGVGGFDWWPLVIFGVAAVLIAGLIVWHKRNPSGQTKALMDAHAAMSAAADKAHEALLWSQQHVADLLAKDKTPITIGAVSTASPEVVPTGVIWSATGIDQDKLDAVEAARVAYENAKADAGIP